jgi:hypothetical protein
MSPPVPADSLTFVCCIESGPLEWMTLLLAESLRRWGGAFARCPLLAITPRRGPVLSRDTRAGLDRLDVTHLKLPRGNRHAWFGFLNKPAALAEAEDRAQTPCLAWLDSDILVVGAPRELALGPEEDFAACAPDRNIGTTGPDDPFEVYWKKVAEVFDLDLVKFPWIVTETEKARIRLYWNSGVFTWRRGLDLGRHFLDDCERLLASKVASAEAGIFFTDQVALGLTMLRRGLRWRALPHTCNFALGTKIMEQIDPAGVGSASLLHYHDGLWPGGWEGTLRLLRQRRPDVHDWLVSHGPARNPAPWASRALGRVLRWQRDRNVAAYEAECRRY